MIRKYKRNTHQRRAEERFIEEVTPHSKSQQQKKRCQRLARVNYCEAVEPFCKWRKAPNLPAYSPLLSSELRSPIRVLLDMNLNPEVLRL